MDQLLKYCEDRIRQLSGQYDHALYEKCPYEIELDGKISAYKDIIDWANRKIMDA